MPDSLTDSTTTPTDMTIKTDIGNPIEIVGTIGNGYKSKNDFIVSVAKDIFYSRELKRQTADTLAADAVYCAKRFVQILEKEKLIEF